MYLEKKMEDIEVRINTFGTSQQVLPKVTNLETEKANLRMSEKRSWDKFKNLTRSLNHSWNYDDIFTFPQSWKSTKTWITNDQYELKILKL